MDSPESFREAWDVVERVWADTAERARRLTGRIGSVKLVAIHPSAGFDHTEPSGQCDAAKIVDERVECGVQRTVHGRLA